jgi:glycosyltransferase involved in cell wall biosynthesis
MGVPADRIVYGSVDIHRFIPSERQRLKNTAKPVVLHHCADPNKGSKFIAGVADALGDDFEVRRLDCPSDKVPDAMREADIWLCLSASEGLPTVAMEAMACGLVTVSTNVGVFWKMGEHLKDGFCLRSMGAAVFDWQRRDDPPFVAEIVRTAWSHRMRLTGRPYARRWWSIEQSGKKWTDCIVAAGKKLGVDLKLGPLPRLPRTGVTRRGKAEGPPAASPLKVPWRTTGRP